MTRWHQIYFGLLFIFSSCAINVCAQIENVFVEKYYVSDINDATDTTGGFLEAGSVTYRVYVDLGAGSKLLKIYGDQNHTLLFSSTEKIFNNKIDGQSFAKDFNKTRLQENTVALDSWLTLGQTTRIGAKTYFGTPKGMDDDGTFVGGANNDGGSQMIPGGLLTNTDPAAGIPLTVADGYDTMTVLPSSWISYGIINDTSSVDSTMFGSVKEGYEFISNNAGLQNSGVSGINADSNFVLIGQLTTKGNISFEINLVVEEPAMPNPVQVKYVARLANGEVNSDTLKLCPFLKYPAECGCTDPAFLEYDPSAPCQNNDSCRTLIFLGCMDSAACNYDPNANYNIEALCCYPGYCGDRDLSVVCPGLDAGRARDINVNVYPNPAKDKLNVEFKSDVECPAMIEVISSTGKLLDNYFIGNGTSIKHSEIKISDYTKGIYLLRIISGSYNYSIKFIKED
jgi:hypothetical protein